MCGAWVWRADATAKKAESAYTTTQGTRQKPQNLKTHARAGACDDGDGAELQDEQRTCERQRGVVPECCTCVVKIHASGGRSPAEGRLHARGRVRARCGRGVRRECSRCRGGGQRECAHAQ